MAKKRRRKYSRGSGEEVRREMHRYKRGRAKSGRGGKGGGEKPKTGDRHCTFQGTQERQEGSSKEALRRSPKLAKRSHWRSRQTDRLTFSDRLETKWRVLCFSACTRGAHQFLKIRQNLE